MHTPQKAAIIRISAALERLPVLFSSLSVRQTIANTIFGINTRSPSSPRLRLPIIPPLVPPARRLAFSAVLHCCRISISCSPPQRCQLKTASTYFPYSAHQLEAPTKLTS